MICFFFQILNTVNILFCQPLRVIIVECQNSSLNQYTSGEHTTGSHVKTIQWFTCRDHQRFTCGDHPTGSHVETIQLVHMWRPSNWFTREDHSTGSHVETIQLVHMWRPPNWFTRGDHPTGSHVETTQQAHMRNHSLVHNLRCNPERCLKSILFCVYCEHTKNKQRQIVLQHFSAVFFTHHVFFSVDDIYYTTNFFFAGYFAPCS